MFCDGYDYFGMRSGCFDLHEYNKITMNHDETELLFEHIEFQKYSQFLNFSNFILSLQR